MTWEEFMNSWSVKPYDPNSITHVKTDIQCPICCEYLYRDDSVVLFSDPPQHKYSCDKCGWRGTGF